jgi:hypothetical protein
MRVTDSIYSLTNIERRALLEVAEECLAIRTLADFEAWINGPVKKFFPHERLVCAIGRLLGEDIRIEHLIGINYPEACLNGSTGSPIAANAGSSRGGCRNTGRKLSMPRTFAAVVPEGARERGNGGRHQYRGLRLS